MSGLYFSIVDNNLKLFGTCSICVPHEMTNAWKDTKMSFKKVMSFDKVAKI